MELKKVNTHERVIVKALLDSRTTEMFVDKEFVKKHRFKTKKLGKAIEVKNMDDSSNSGEKIKEKTECNIFFEGHVE